LRKKVGRWAETRYVYALQFSKARSYTLKASVGPLLAFKQEYRVLDGEIEEDPDADAVLEEKIAKLGEPRLLADIPDSVQALVQSWLRANS
jgi:hypothetical protein